jgi:hypothetical protein
MKGRGKTILLLLPLLCAAWGWGWAYLEYNAIREPWRFAGQPGEKVVQLLGFQEGGRLLVETESGRLYSLPFLEWGSIPADLQIRWTQPEQEAASAGGEHPWGKGSDEFIVRSPPAAAQQIIGHAYLYKVEGRGEVWFALSGDGNVWMWSHQAGGFRGLEFVFLSAVGFLMGLAALLVIGVANWIAGRARSASMSRGGYQPDN